MRLNDNGVYRDSTVEEIAKMERLAAEMPAPEPTAEERMNEIEAALIELAAMVGGVWYGR